VKNLSENKITGQTAEETGGIPTPPDQEDMAATDMISETVAEIMDNIREEFDDDDSKQPK